MAQQVDIEMLRLSKKRLKDLEKVMESGIPKVSQVVAVMTDARWALSVIDLMLSKSKRGPKGSRPAKTEQ